MRTLEVFPEDDDILPSYFIISIIRCEGPLSNFELVDKEFDKQDDISVSIENSIRLEVEPGDTDVDVSKKLVAVNVVNLVLIFYYVLWRIKNPENNI